jgi:hypothetical protein
MADLDTFPVVPVDNDKLYDGYFQGIANFLAKQNVISRYDAIVADSASDIETAQAFIYDRLTNNKASTSHVNTSESTCLYDETGLVAFCDVLDLFDDASVSASIWTTSTASGGTVTESGGSLTANATSTSGSNATARTAGASGLNCHGKIIEVILSYTVNHNYGFGGGSSSPSPETGIYISNGSTRVQVVGASGATNFSESGYLRLVFNSANNTVDVWKRTSSASSETLTTDNLDVSSVTTNKYIEAYCNRTTNTAFTYSASNVAFKCIGYRENGAGAANAIFSTTNNALVASSTYFFTHPFFLLTPSGTPTIVVSADGTTNYGSGVGYDSFAAAPAAGSNFRFKLTVAKNTTITANSRTVPILKGWGALYG